MIYKKIRCLIPITLLLILTACAPYHANQRDGITYRVRGKQYTTLRNSAHYQEKGTASWYGRRFQHRRTTSGERYNMYQMTAAHKTLPLHTKVLVTNLNNGRQIVVRINDRGPFISNRLIDLSYAAAKKLNMVHRGTTNVSVKALS